MVHAAKVLEPWSFGGEARLSPDLNDAEPKLAGYSGICGRMSSERVAGYPRMRDTIFRPGLKTPSL